MPIAVLIGVCVALGRKEGPAAVRLPLTAYVELIRGTPLMLQLFVLFYLVVPKVLPPLVELLPTAWQLHVPGLVPYLAGIAGLALGRGSVPDQLADPDLGGER